MSEKKVALNKIKLHYLDDVGNTHSKKMSEWLVENGLVQWIEFCIMVSLFIAMLSGMMDKNQSEVVGMAISGVLTVSLWVNVAKMSRNVKIKRFITKEDGIAYTKPSCLSAMTVFHAVTHSITIGYALVSLSTLASLFGLYDSLTSTDAGLLLISGILSFVVVLSQLRCKFIIKKMNEKNVTIELIK